MSFDLPGLSKDDISIEIHDGQLRVKGERKLERKEKGYSEKRYGHFERSIAKADEVKPKAIQISEGKKEGIWDRLLGGQKDELKN